ncbi:hypothetical protein KY290_029634 [Solanum tuberosum]|uniref:Uncharacterized protein n=1 Tax=Solanum tuberosum TaxID=4113 RepID=A0ABQ7ULC8_SOLTU|nr:hypothetical protein KY284_011804 [Solanum tuberosum]KAH0750402.1 hypothetical protein KY290_029634 [Solanum tuberosum]
MRDQETDREGMAYQSLVDLPLNQSRSSQLSCLGSGIPSLVGAFDSKKCGAGSSLSTSSVYGEGDKGEAPNMFYPQPPSVISNLNSLFLFTSTLRATTSSPFTRGCLLLAPISKVAYALHLLPLNDEARSGRRDLNPQPQPWQGYALPLSYFRQLGAAIGASCKESWSRVKLGRHFILVTGMSAPQDQTSCSLASQRRHLSFKLSHFLRRLLLFYDNPSCSGTSRTSYWGSTIIGICECLDARVLFIFLRSQQLCSAFSADCQPVQLTSEDSCHPAQHVYSRRRLQPLSQGQATPEDQQSSPVASLPVAS